MFSTPLKFIVRYRQRRKYVYYKNNESYQKVLKGVEGRCHQYRGREDEGEDEDEGEKKPGSKFSDLMKGDVQIKEWENEKI